MSSYHAQFIERTASVHRNMRVRLEKRGLALPFTLDRFREQVLAFFGGEEGVQLCRYCRVPVGVTEFASDHAIPLKRGGTPGLENIEFPCPSCNARKGGLTPSEYLDLLEFLDQQGEAVKTDVLNRLQIAVQLAAGKSWHRAKGRKGK